VDGRRPKPAFIAAILALHLGVTALTWRDIRRRSDDQIRGSKRLWRGASALQMGNSLAYWVFGRKQGDKDSPGTSA
jgi:hypothetical protein